ncbi:MAG: carboxypeptidase-like regulatory domain-containing protein [Vicinamibacterales bacterium]
MLGVVVTLVLAGISGDAQSREAQRAGAPRSGALSGIVLDATTGAPIPSAAVALRVIEPFVPAGREVASAVTDRDGRFVFVEVAPADSFRVHASRPGYLAYRSPVTFPIEPGRWIDDVRLLLTPAGHVEARLALANGEPVLRAQVRLWQELWIAGQSRLVPVARSTTDDAGTALFANLQPGRYAVCLEAVQATLPPDVGPGFRDVPARAALAQAPAVDVHGVRLLVDGALLAPDVQGQPMTYRPACEPATAGSTSEGLIAVEPGQEKQVGLALLAVPGFRVSGQVTGPAASYAGLPLRLSAVDGAGSSFGGRRDVATTFVDARGQFTFVNVAAGEYLIEPGDAISSYVQGTAGATPPMPPAGWTSGSISQAPVTTSTAPVKLESRDDRNVSRHWGRTRVAVGRDIDNLVFRLGPAGRLEARLSWPERPTSSVWVRLEPADGDPSLGVPLGYSPSRKFEPDGAAVTVDGIRPGAYFLRLSGSGTSGWAIRSIRHGGEQLSSELAERPIEWQAGEDLTGVVIEISRDVASVSGHVRDADEKRAGATVIVFPTDRTAWSPLGLAPPRLRAVPVTITAQYRIADLPAGTYYVTAIRGVPPPDWVSVPVLERLAAKAEERELRSGAGLTINLTAVEFAR